MVHRWAWWELQSRTVRTMGPEGCFNICPPKDSIHGHDISWTGVKAHVDNSFVLNEINALFFPFQLNKRSWLRMWAERLNMVGVFPSYFLWGVTCLQMISCAPSCMWHVPSTWLTGLSAHQKPFWIVRTCLKPTFQGKLRCSEIECIYWFYWGSFLYRHWS